MSNRTLVVALGVLLVAAAAWYIIVIRGVGIKPPSVNTLPLAEPAPEPTPIQPAPEPTPSESPTVNSEQKTQQVLAMTFAERYGTYSTDAAFANLRRLTTLVTPDYAAVLQAQADGALPGAGGFYSVTTRAMSGEVTLTSDASVVVKVTTQQQEQFSRTGEPRLSYRVLTVTLERQGNGWLVAGARWEK